MKHNLFSREAPGEFGGVRVVGAESAAHVEQHRGVFQARAARGFVSRQLVGQRGIRGEKDGERGRRQIPFDRGVGDARGWDELEKSESLRAGGFDVNDDVRRARDVQPFGRDDGKERGATSEDVLVLRGGTGSITASRTSERSTGILTEDARECASERLALETPSLTPGETSSNLGTTPSPVKTACMVHPVPLLGSTARKRSVPVRPRRVATRSRESARWFTS